MIKNDSIKKNAGVSEYLKNIFTKLIYICIFIIIIQKQVLHQSTVSKKKKKKAANYFEKII